MTTEELSARLEDYLAERAKNHSTETVKTDRVKISQFIRWLEAQGERR